MTAATKEVDGRSKWILAGLGLGILGSITIAFFTDKISASLGGMGQEFFNGLVLLTAAAMISWTTLWMQKHAKSLSGEFKKLGSEIRLGEKPLYILLIAVFLSVLREGAEIALITYSYYISGIELEQILLGLVSGITLGAMFGTALYFGMLKVFGRYFFMITTWILVFLAAGIAAHGAGFLIDAELIPSLYDPVFDSSQILSQESFFGKFLHIFFGYIDRPAGSQLVAYFLTLGILVMGLMRTKTSSSLKS